MKTHLKLSILCSCICVGIISQAANLSATISNQSDTYLEDAVVYLTATDGQTLEYTQKNEVVDQINKQFVQKVKIVTVGSKVSFPNKDDIHHHVYSFSEPKNFELPLYEGVPSELVEFPKKGVVSLGCNIHDWMKGYVVVVDTPYYAKSTKNGSLEISGITPGNYIINYWHPNLQGAPQQEPIQIKAGNNSLVKQLKTKTKIKARRAPRGRDRGY